MDLALWAVIAGADLDGGELAVVEVVVVGIEVDVRLGSGPLFALLAPKRILTMC